MQKNTVPTTKDCKLLPQPVGGVPSPDGTKVAFLLRLANWPENLYKTDCYIYRVKGESSHILTRNADVRQIEWIDSNSLAVLKAQLSGGDNKGQIWIYDNLVGDPIKITDHKTGVQSFKTFADGVLFIANDPDREEQTERGKELGTFVHVEQEESPSALYYVSIPKVTEFFENRRKLPKKEAEKLTFPVIEISRGSDRYYSISGIVPSPLHNEVYINFRVRDDLVYLADTLVFRVKIDVDSELGRALQMRNDDADEGKPNDPIGEWEELPLPKGSGIVDISPDGSKLLISHQIRDLQFYTISDLFILPVDSVKAGVAESDVIRQWHCISADIDRTLFSATWTMNGIYAGHFDYSKGHVVHISENGKITTLDLAPWHPAYQLTAGRSGAIAFIGNSTERPNEVVYAFQDSAGWHTTALTDIAGMTDTWDFGSVESVTWKSKDGTEIEGILRKPSDFDPTKKHPLLLLVHGGPAGTSLQTVFGYEEAGSYPIIQFLARKMLVLMPNYRGSIGRGQAFMELNKNNLGIGDLWDIESAVDHFVAQGYVDEKKVGCMGWSQGGYISAMATTHSEKFAATSVGAGISDWYTYYITTDIRQFTRHYLSGTPAEQPERYAKTAPISKVDQATTPTLIQHGTDDRRVPYPNATELYRRLQDAGAQVELIAYPNMPHGINKPRESRAVMLQNYRWFCHHLLGDELELFTPDSNGVEA